MKKRNETHQYLDVTGAGLVMWSSFLSSPGICSTQPEKIGLVWWFVAAEWCGPNRQHPNHKKPQIKKSKHKQASGEEGGLSFHRFQVNVLFVWLSDAAAGPGPELCAIFNCFHQHRNVSSHHSSDWFCWKRTRLVLKLMQFWGEASFWSISDEYLSHWCWNDWTVIILWNTLQSWIVLYLVCIN